MSATTLDSTLAHLQNQVSLINKEMKVLKTELFQKDRMIGALEKEIHRIQNDFNSQKKKLKSEMSRIESKITNINSK